MNNDSMSNISSIQDLSDLLNGIQQSLYANMKYPVPERYEENKKVNRQYEQNQQQEQQEQQYDRYPPYLPPKDMKHEKYGKYGKYGKYQQQHEEYDPACPGLNGVDGFNGVDTYRQEAEKFLNNINPIIVPNQKPEYFSQKATNTVFVCNLNYMATESDLVHYFQPIGHVINVKIMEKQQNNHRKRWAFVTFLDITTAERCISLLNQKVFMSRVLGISFARF